MKIESERLTLAGLAALPLLGCNEEPDCSDELASIELPGELPDNGSNPTLLEARWLSSDVLELQFSEPLEALDPLDPIAPARFRVMGWNINTQSYYYSDDCSIYTAYYPIRQGNNYPAELWQAPEDAAVLRLRMNAPVTCATPDDPLTGLLLFYTNDPLTTGNASVRDVEGNQLPDIGPSWALSSMVSCAANYAQGGMQGYYYYYGPYCSGLTNTFSGSFPVLPSILAIPCPGT